jgi:hypothetical protein
LAPHGGRIRNQAEKMQRAHVFSTQAVLFVMLVGCAGAYGPREPKPLANSELDAGSGPLCAGADKVALDWVSEAKRAELASQVARTLDDASRGAPAPLLFAKVDGCSVSWVPACTASAQYNVARVSIDDEQEFSSDEARRWLSDQPPENAPGSVRRERRIRGVLGIETDLAKPWQESLSGDCSDATHVVRTVALGASHLERMGVRLESPAAERSATDEAVPVAEPAASGEPALAGEPQVARDPAPNGELPPPVDLGKIGACGDPERLPASGIDGARRSLVLLGEPAPAAALPPPPGPALPLLPEGCDAAIELQLEAITCPDPASEWASGKCALKPLAQGLADIGSEEVAGLAKQVPTEPKSRAEIETAVSQLTKIIATLCGKRDGSSFELGAGDCVGRSAQEYRGIAIAAGHLIEVGPGTKPLESDKPAAATVKQTAETALEYPRNSVSEGWYWKGTALLALGEAVRGLASYQRVTELSRSLRTPGALEVFANRACSAGRGDEAKILYSQIASQHGSTPEGARATELMKVTEQRCGNSAVQMKR